MSLTEIEFLPEEVQIDSPWRTVEVQTVDGEGVWLTIPSGSFGGIASQLVRDRHLIGRYIGRPGEEFEGHRMLIPIERIKRVIDVDN